MFLKIQDSAFYWTVFPQLGYHINENHVYISCIQYPNPARDFRASTSRSKIPVIRNSANVGFPQLIRGYKRTFTVMHYRLQYSLPPARD